MRVEVDDYVDTKLANFEVVLDEDPHRGAPGPGQAARARHRGGLGRPPGDSGMAAHPLDRGDPLG